MDVHFSSQSVEWSTPQDFFDKLNAAFDFTLDACALPENAKAPEYYTPEEDGLSKPWNGRVWMNPPYGRGISAWVQKAYESSTQGALVVCLLPARTDTRWWHNYVQLGHVQLIPGRLKFGGAKHNAPFPCALVMFYPKPWSDGAARV